MFVSLVRSIEVSLGATNCMEPISVVTGSLSGGGGVARRIGKVHYGLCENGEFIWFISGKVRRMSQELVVWVCKYFMLHVA